MNDCCASSSSRDKLAASASATLPSYAVRPGVTFPDWSVVTSPAVKDALLAMVGSDHVLDRWSGYDPATDRVRVALLELYSEDGRAPTTGALAKRAGLNETSVRTLLEELRRRDLVVLDGERIVGAYPFTDQRHGPPGHTGRTCSQRNVRGRRTRHWRHDRSRHHDCIALPPLWCANPDHHTGPRAGAGADRAADGRHVAKRSLRRRMRCELAVRDDRLLLFGRPSLRLAP